MTAEKKSAHVHKIILDLGCPCKYNGCRYLLDGIDLILENPMCIGCLKKNIYFEIAKKHRTSVDNIERSIRTLVNKWWEATKCGGIFSKKPTNGELIYTLFTKINIEIKLIG